MPAVSEPSLLLTSSLEEDGFEPSVPREREKIGVVDGIETPLSQSLSARRSAASPFSRGFCCSKLRAFSEMQAPTGPGGLERDLCEQPVTFRGGGLDSFQWLSAL
jgi:hypothetical protein